MFDDPEPWDSIHELALEYHLYDGHTVDEAVDGTSPRLRRVPCLAW